MKLAIILNDDKLSGKLTKIFTGCAAYHAAWVDEDEGLMYDMHWIRRRRLWPHYRSGQVILHDFPKVTREYLEERLSTDEVWYGVLDYVLFALRPIYHLFGKSTRNASGQICSGMINLDLIACGYATPWPVLGAEPSPCDLLRWIQPTASCGE